MLIRFRWLIGQFEKIRGNSAFGLGDVQTRSAHLLTDVPSCLPQGAKAWGPSYAHERTKWSHHSPKIPQTTQDNHSFSLYPTHTHWWVCQWSTLCELTIVPCGLQTMRKPNPYSVLVQWPLVEKKIPGQGAICKWMDSIHYIPHTHTQQECGLNEQGVPAPSIQALLVYGCLQHNSAWSLYKNMEPVVWWVTAGEPVHLFSGLHCISWWSVPGIILCV